MRASRADDRSHQRREEESKRSATKRHPEPDGFPLLAAIHLRRFPRRNPNPPSREVEGHDVVEEELGVEEAVVDHFLARGGAFGGTEAGDVEFHGAASVRWDRIQTELGEGVRRDEDRGDVAGVELEPERAVLALDGDEDVEGGAAGLALDARL